MAKCLQVESEQCSHLIMCRRLAVGVHLRIAMSQNAQSLGLATDTNAPSRSGFKALIESFNSFIAAIVSDCM